MAAGHAEGETDGPYLLDSGDRLRIFIYGHPNLSRLYTVDQEGMVPVPLIGEVRARGRTTRSLARAIAARLGAQYVREPQVTVDIAQNRPFFILGEVRNAGQYPYVSGMTVKAAVAIAGGYADRADERRIQITRRHNGIIEKMDVPPRLRGQARRHALRLRALALRRAAARAAPADAIASCTVLRAPVGGLFRHVCDLAAEQARRGHAVGVVCDAGSAMR